MIRDGEDEGGVARRERKGSEQGLHPVGAHFRVKMLSGFQMYREDRFGKFQENNATGVLFYRVLHCVKTSAPSPPVTFDSRLVNAVGRVVTRVLYLKRNILLSTTVHIVRADFMNFLCSVGPHDRISLSINLPRCVSRFVIRQFRKVLPQEI